VSSLIYAVAALGFRPQVSLNRESIEPAHPYQGWRRVPTEPISETLSVGVVRLPAARCRGKLRLVKYLGLGLTSRGAADRVGKHVDGMEAVDRVSKGKGEPDDDRR
jgi:hypothetical protein